MEHVLTLFVRFLRLRGLRVSTAEVVDAARALVATGFADRERVRESLLVTLVKDARDAAVFDEVFDAFFRLTVPLPWDGSDGGPEHAHADVEAKDVQRVTMSDDVSATPKQTHAHGETADVRDYFDEKDMASAYQAHQEGDKRDLTSLSDELLVSGDDGSLVDGLTHRLEVERLGGVGSVGDLAAGDGGARLDADLSLAEQEALLSELADLGGTLDDADRAELDRLRAQVSGLVDDLPALLEEHLRRLLEEGRGAAAATPRPAFRTEVTEAERERMEEVLRRLAKRMRGAPRRHRSTTRRGRIDVSRTARGAVRYDGVPFHPSWHTRRDERPRLVVLADVSLSVRNTTRFTLHLVHGLQSMFTQIRTFAFVADVTEITSLFHEHAVEEALGVVLGGEVLDCDASSDYGAVLESFVRDHGDAVTARSTVLVLGDGRGNGRPPGLEALQEIKRRARQLLWLTPEQRAYWGYAGSDMESYARICDRVEVARNLDQLDAVADDLLDPDPVLR